ncbi:HupE/UreJ family protein [Flavobacterium subsaxonicum]|uniref:HupE / UreJ protein n=1 Tax=Flavobacterium subsaxonicum WB 4.1-42 = DSM 21790 TaxID=1121898 RepID=A0A0A2MIU2_9FLAO|nr:HupE/UreJ family protein [Flavobacterium subsaxonicum]KGO92184.1 HupE / UreJ protein [Flavobacterium subsaxonicum WB 4.1-42 = DSM 21790]
MPDFWLYFQIGLKHVLDLGGYDHVMFLMALTVPYSFKDWRNVLLLATLFTIGHTLSLILSVYGVVRINSTFVEFLIPVTILITALYNIITSGKKAAKTQSINFVAFTTLFFGIIHGLGFSNYFKIIINNDSDSKLAPLLEFALGIEAAQLIVVLTVLVLSFIMQGALKVQRRDWLLVTSAFVAGVVLPMIISAEIW